MRKNRFLTRLSSGAFVVAVATGAVLLTDGVSDAAATAASPQVTTAATTTTTELDVSATSVTYGTPVTLTATITPAAAGTVQFKDGNNTNLGETTVSNGKASRSISTLTPGRHSLTAEFTPTDPATSGSTSDPVTLVVTRQETILTESPGTMYLLSISKVELAAKLTEAPTGKPIEGRMIDFYGSDGQLLCHASTNATGLAQCSGAEDVLGHIVRGVPGGYEAEFLGDDYYGPSTQNASGTIGITHPR
jgi:hypothetical protein